MICPKCGGETRITETRHENENRTELRRRICKNCGHQFRTHEVQAIYAGVNRGIILDLQGVDE
jgi:transcriptional regulator NrdR family protein